MSGGSENRVLLLLENDNSSQPNDNSNPSSNVMSSPNLNVSAESIAYVRLPSFWRHSPREWFLHAEAVFANNRLRSDVSKANHVIAALDEEGVKSVYNLIGPNVCFESLKQRLIATFAVPQSTCFRSITQPGGIGNRRPTQLLHDMRSILPDGIGEDALKQFWLQKLPPTTSAFISGQDGSLEDLAARADRVMEATSYSADVHAVNKIKASTDRFRAMENVIIALTTLIASLVTLQSTKRYHGSSRSRSKSRSGNNNLCYYHDRFGASANKCKPPCAYKSSEN